MHAHACPCTGRTHAELLTGGRSDTRGHGRMGLVVDKVANAHIRIALYNTHTHTHNIIHTPVMHTHTLHIHNIYTCTHLHMPKQ